MGDEVVIPAETIIAARAEGVVCGLEDLRTQILTKQSAGEVLSVQDVLRLLEEAKISAFDNPRRS